jgi:DNA polymerase elongation subunit (family B)/ribonuclease HI
MSRFETFNFYSYLWSSDDEEGIDGKQCVIRVYGWNEKGESSYLKISDVLLPQVVELDDSIEWNDSRINMVCGKLQTLSRLPEFRPRTIVTKDLSRSYYAFVEKNPDYDKGGLKYKHKKFQYLVPYFASEEACGRFAADIKRGIDVSGMGKIFLKCHKTSKTITPDMKFRGIRELPSCGWMKVSGIRMTPDEKESTRKNEYSVSYTDLKAIPENESMKMPIIMPKVMAFDNEANSTYMNSMPKPKRPGDKTFQIGFTILDPAKDGRPKQCRKFLISMGELDPIEGVVIIPVKSEADLYVTFAEKLREEDPEIVIGYNILGWDINYMITRCKEICRCMGEFDQMGCLIGKHCPEDKISWGSSGAGKNEFKFLKVDGRIFIDLLPYIKRNHKLPNYRLETVCEEFLKSNKDPVKPKEIFKAWRKWNKSYAEPENIELRKEIKTEMARIGKYCNVDSLLCILLFEKLRVWADLTESATVCQVNIFDMFARGQQLKMFAQVYRYCFKNEIAVEVDAYKAKDDEFYEGAYVGEPLRGLYNRIIPLDFCLTGDALITQANGTSIRMKNIAGSEDVQFDVLSYNEQRGLEFDTAINGLQDNGEREVMKITLEDGTEIKATPDHKFATLDGWNQCKDLVGKFVVSGIEYPEDVVGNDEKDWKLVLNDREFNMGEKRAESLAFARILGYTIFKGEFYDSKIKVSFKTKFDLESFLNDLELIIGSEQEQQITYFVNEIVLTIPRDISDLIRKIFNVSSTELEWPLFLDDKCPLAIAREFIGGIYGGNARSKSLIDKNSPDSASLEWICEHENILVMQNALNFLQHWHKLLGIDSTAKQLEDLDDESWVMGLKLSKFQIGKFARLIGFRYCINENCRLAIAKSYEGLCAKANPQDNNCITFNEYIRQLRVDHWFDSNAVKIKHLHAPHFLRRVISVEAAGKERVYDIQVKDNHSFIANGVISHNCSLYPSLMQAFNIDYSKLVIDPKIPDEDCYVMTWSSHLYCGCPKDECPGEKPPKMKDGRLKRVCAEYKYRWLKHDVSGRGILPTLLINLLSARKKTRKIIAANVAEIKFLKGEPLNDEDQPLFDARLELHKNGTEPNPAIAIILKGIEKMTEADKIIIKERIEILEGLNLVLDRRQNAYKVNANSMYGAMGVREGYLPFLPGAMCVTFMGRTYIHRANKFIQEEEGGIVIYNDTDSSYCRFPRFDDKPVKELWEHAKQVSHNIKRILPPEMSMEFENKIYKKFLILSKKRYAAISIDENGKEDSKLMKRGIILQRRDNCACLRETYQNAITMIFKYHEELIALRSLIDPILSADVEAMKQWEEKCNSLKAERNREIAEEQKLVISDQNSDADGIELKKAKKKGPKKKKLTKKDLPPEPKPNAPAIIMKHPVVLELLKMIVLAAGSLFEWKYNYKSFVITKQITRDIKEYKNPNRLPGHVQLGMKMAKRGIAIGGGTRIEYVILKHGSYSKQDTQTSKIEDASYFAEFREILRLSYLDYLRQFIKPLDDLLKVAIGLEDFVDGHFKQRIQYSKVVDRIQELTRPKIEFTGGDSEETMPIKKTKKSSAKTKTKSSSIAKTKDDPSIPVSISLTPFYSGNAGEEKKIDIRAQEIRSIYCDGCCNSKTRNQGWGTVVDDRGRDLLMPAENAYAYEGMDSNIENLPMGTTRIIVANFNDVTKQNNNGAELLALVAALRIALEQRNIKIINSDSALIVDYWSKNMVNKETRNKMDPEKLIMIEECARLREIWEKTGGRIVKISGDDNLADPGFSHGTKTKDARTAAMRR